MLFRSASAALGSAEAWECELVKMATEINKAYGGDKHHKEAERVCHLQLHTLRDTIADVKSEYRKVLVCLRLGTDTLLSLKEAELKGVTPKVYFQYPSVSSQILLAGAELLCEPETEERGPPPTMQLVTPINKDKLHNYVVSPGYLSEAIAEAGEMVKGNKEYAHIMDNTCVVLEEPDEVLKAVKGVLQGREKNDMSIIRLSVILWTTNDVNKLTNEIVLSVKELSAYCQTYHTAAGDDHRCMVELAKGPQVPALDCTDKILAHFSDALQEQIGRAHV